MPFHPGRDISPFLLRQIARDIGMAHPGLLCFIAKMKIRFAILLLAVAFAAGAPIDRVSGAGRRRPPPAGIRVPAILARIQAAAISRARFPHHRFRREGGRRDRLHGGHRQSHRGLPRGGRRAGRRGRRRVPHRRGAFAEQREPPHRRGRDAAIQPRPREVSAGGFHPV